MMTEAIRHLAELSADIRQLAIRPVSTDVPDFKPLADNFIEVMRSIDPTDTETAPHVSETVLNLFRISQISKDTQTLKLCLMGMLESGRFGRVLAVRFVHGKAVSARELAAIIQTFPAGIRLALAHEMLLDDPSTHDSQTRAWLEGLVKPLAATEPKELVPFIAHLGQHKETLAFPVRQVVMNGLLGDWLKRHLETGASGEVLDNLCHMVMALNDSQMAETLATSINIGFITATPLSLQTVAEVAEAGSKSVLDMFINALKSHPKEMAAECISGIIAQQSPAAGKLLATLRMKMPSIKKITSLHIPLLGDRDYAAYLKALPKDARDKAQSEAFSALLAIAPDFVETLTRAGTSLTRQAAPPPENGVEVQEMETPSSACTPPGFLARLFGSRKKKLEKLLPKFRNVRDMELTCSGVTDEELDGRELSGLNLAESTFASVRFLRTKVSNSLLNKSAFTDCALTGSTFNTCDFSGVDFSDTTFTNCSFNDCNFTNAAFTNATFSDCRFRGCAMPGSAWISTKIRLTGFTTGTLARATFHETDARTTRFEDMDLTGTEFAMSKFKGVEFINSVFYNGSFTATAFQAVDMPGSSVARNRIVNSDLSHALFLRNRVRQFPRLAREAAAHPLPDPRIIPPEAAAKVVRAWSREITFFRREERMQTFNRARLRRAIASIEREKQVYVRILPHLLHTDVFEKKFDLEDVPPCEVWGYTPSLSALELAKQFFPQHKPSRKKAKVQILGVYAMGSLGTVAQTHKSDVDCWVCYGGDLDLDTEAGLRRKLDALGLWAESEFGLEAHFFPMRMDDVRDNRFSSGEDEESSGSAQALLLKEEFYRTALRLAGKHLAWWVTPPGADQKTYDACIQAIRRYPLTGRPRMEDFGHLAPIPPDEYFGGSLWQMVKAVHSPFKSVLKLGLLETYADPATSPLPLCDRIKQNLFLNRHGVKRTDPYATLFSTLQTYYAKQGDKKAARLLIESFMFKANLCDIPFFMNLPARHEDASLIEALFGKGYAEPEKVCNTDEAWTFDKSLKMGSAVRQYMVSTYQRIQGTLAKGGSADSMINAEDLTRMGRRIGSNFSQKPNKIMRVPFMDTKGGGFPILHLSAEKAPGKKPVWVARGGSKAEAKKSADSLQLLHRSGDAALMLTWLLANRIYTPQSLLQADRTIAPIAVADLQKLMPAMYDFFPFDQTFERDINEGLDPERVMRVFFIFNLTAPAETKKIVTATAIYSTNWGEMFCRTFDSPGELLEKYPSRFLAQHLDQPVPEVPEMILFLPKGSQCKRINLI